MMKIKITDLSIEQRLFLFVDRPTKVGKRTWKPNRVTQYTVREINYNKNIVLLGIGRKNFWKTEEELQRFSLTDPRSEKV